MNTYTILKSFKENLITFLDELIGQLPKEGDLIIARIFLNDQVPIEIIVKYFCLNLLPLKDLVKNRDSGFFLNNNILFSEISRDKVNHFKILWRSGNLDEDDRETIFRWFDTFLFLSEKYQNSL
jgi:hypothetical protein